MVTQQHSPLFSREFATSGKNQNLLHFRKVNSPSGFVACFHGFPSHFRFLDRNVKSHMKIVFPLQRERDCCCMTVKCRADKKEQPFYERTEQKKAPEKSEAFHIIMNNLNCFLV